MAIATGSTPERPTPRDPGTELMNIRLFHRRLAVAACEAMPVGARIVCAVSGGPDSMALLHGLEEVNRIYKRRWILHVAHLDHALRPESAQDAAFVKQIAAQLDLPCSIQRRAVAAGRTKSETLEEAARRIRYAFLQRVATTIGAEYVVTGHQADDQAETVLHHIVRGTGLRGLGGMSSCRPIRPGSNIKLVRPLLVFRRAELSAYLTERRLPSCHDVTNEDPSLARRNLLRAEILPLLEKRLNPEIVAALCRLAEQARRSSASIESYAEQALKRAEIRSGKNLVVLKVRSLAALSKAVRAEVVLMALRCINARMQEIGFERIEAATEAPLGAGRRKIELPGRIIVQRHRQELWIQRKTSTTKVSPKGRRKSR